MVDDNAINPETGETVYVPMWKPLPKGFWWTRDMDTDDWLKLVRRLTLLAADKSGLGAAPENLPSK